MPITQPSPVTPMIPAGEHMLTLHEVVVKEVDNMKFLKGDKTAPPKVNKWLWRFLSDDLDPESDPPQPYELAVWTFANYGHAKANLTKLLDMIVPKATPEQKAHLDTDKILGRRFKAMVVHETAETGEGVKPVAKYIVPAGPNDPVAPQRVAPAATEPADEIPV